MANQDTQASWDYHDATKHSPLSVRHSTHSLDWSNQPIPFKIYPKLEPLRLDPSIVKTEVPALLAVSASGFDANIGTVPDLNRLVQLLYFSAGVTKTIDYPGGTRYFRAAPCTGALYEFELYIVCSDLDGLDAGVYHFSPGDLSLRRLREGDFRGLLSEAIGTDPAAVGSPVTIVCAGTYWRNAWKYQARTYRHFGWDNGTILANMLAIAAALNLPAQVTCGFVDHEVNRLLDLDTEREVAFSMMQIGRASAPGPVRVQELLPLNLDTVALSKSEVHYPEMGQMHQASSLATGQDVVAWSGCLMPLTRKAAPSNGTVFLSPLSDAEIPRDAIESVILRRGSTRQFARVPITMEQFSTMLDRATRGIRADFLGSDRPSLNELYLIVNAVDGIDPGSYVFDRDKKQLEQLGRGDFRGVAAHLGLDQALPGDASVAVFFLADLKEILGRFGNRGYRAVQLEAGILGGKLYLAAYAQRLGSTGLTFYDDEVIRFFSPHAAGKSGIFMMALGKSAKRSR